VAKAREAELKTSAAMIRVRRKRLSCCFVSLRRRLGRRRFSTLPRFTLAAASRECANDDIGASDRLKIKRCSLQR
jgi:hypothetical protein